MDTLWEAAKDSEMKETLSPEDEEACMTAHNPQAERQAKSRKSVLRTRPDDTAHHTEKKTMVPPRIQTNLRRQTNYLERKEDMTNKQYERFMDIHRKAKGTGWTSQQLNFVVGSVEITMTYFHPV